MSSEPSHTAASHGVGRAYLLLTITTLCWAGNAIFGKLAVGEVSPMLLVSLRWCGAVLLLAVFANKYIRQDWSIIRKHLLFLFIMGATGFTGFNSLFYVAAHSTTALNIGIIQGAMPAMVMIGAVFLYKMPVSLFQAIGVFATFLGVVVVGIGGDISRLAELEFNQGDLLMLAAGVLYSAYTLGLRKRPQTSALGLFTILAFAAFLISIPLTVSEYVSGQQVWPSAEGWIIVTLITLFPSFIAQICFIHGVEQIGPGRAGVFINLVPIFAAIFAVTYLGEPFELFHAVALAMVFGGIWIAERSRAA